MRNQIKQVLLILGGILLSLAFLSSAKAAEDHPVSIGTGFAVTSDGVIATAHHVIHPDGAHGPIQVIIDHKLYFAVIIAEDSTHDLTLIKVFPKVPLNAAVLALPTDGVQATFKGYSGYKFPNLDIAYGTVKLARMADPNEYDLRYYAKTCGGMSGGPVIRTDGAVIGTILAGITQDEETSCGNIGYGNSSIHIIKLMIANKLPLNTYQTGSVTIVLIIRDI